MATLKNSDNQKLISQEKVKSITVKGEKGSIDKIKSILPSSKKSPNSVWNISEQERRDMIAVNAYFRAQTRNFSSGNEYEDWLAAEAEINGILSKVKKG